MVGSRDAFESDPRYNQRSYIPQQGSYGTYMAQNQASSSHIPSYSQAPLSSPSVISDFSFRFPAPDSNTTSSPFISPRSQIPAYATQQNSNFQQQIRYPTQNYVQNQISAILPSQAPRIAHSTSLQPQYASVEQSQNDFVRSYTGVQGSDDASFMPTGIGSRQSSSRENYNGFPQPTQQTEQMGRSQQYRHNSFSAPLPNLLPPLQSTVASIPSAMAITPGYENYMAPDNRASTHVVQPGSTRSQERYGNYSQSGVDSSRQLQREPD